MGQLGPFIECDSDGYRSAVWQCFMDGSVDYSIVDELYARHLLDHGRAYSSPDERTHSPSTRLSHTSGMLHLPRGLHDGCCEYHIPVSHGSMAD
jgi:hypothetical protein